MPKTKKSQARKGRGKASGSPRGGGSGDPAAARDAGPVREVLKRWIDELPVNRLATVAQSMRRGGIQDAVCEVMGWDDVNEPQKADVARDWCDLVENGTRRHNLERVGQAFELVRTLEDQKHIECGDLAFIVTWFSNNANESEYAEAMLALTPIAMRTLDRLST